MSTRGPSRRSEAAAPAFDVAFDPQDEEEDGVGPPIDDEDDEGRCPSSSIILILVLQRSLMTVYYSIVLPSSRQYAEDLGGGGKGFSGGLIGATAISACLMTPIYAAMIKRRAGYAACFHFQVVCMQVGSIMYSLAKLANSKWLLLSSRAVGGMGTGAYPVLQYVTEYTGKKHRSRVSSLVGMGRSLGYALGPVLASILVYVDFTVGELTIDKMTNPGWTIAIACVGMTALIVWLFPRHASKATREPKQIPEASPRPATFAGRALHASKLAFVMWVLIVGPLFNGAWEVGATGVLQTRLQWSIPHSALLVGGWTAITIGVLFFLGKLSMRYTDIQILIWAFGLNLLSSFMLYDFGPSKTIFASTYLSGSLVFLNAAIIMNVFGMSMASKVCRIEERDTMMAVANTTTFLFRGVGAIMADALTTNELAMTYSALSLVTVVAGLALYRALNDRTHQA